MGWELYPPGIMEKKKKRTGISAQPVFIIIMLRHMLSHFPQIKLTA
jgi:hypothetical protein